MSSPQTTQQERDEIERIVSNISSGPPTGYGAVDRHSRPHYSSNVSTSSDGVPELLRREGYQHSPTQQPRVHASNGLIGTLHTPPSSPGLLTRSNLGDSINTGWSTSSSLFNQDNNNNNNDYLAGTASSPQHIRQQQPSHRMSVTATPPAPPRSVAQYMQLDESAGGAFGSSGRSSGFGASASSARLSGSTAVVAAMKALQTKIGVLESERDAVLHKCSALETSLNETQLEGNRRLQVSTQNGIIEQAFHRCKKQRSCAWHLSCASLSV
jgi:hypothetical protein